MFFMKTSADTTKDRINKLETSLDHLRDTTFKKEDFREFKDELWVRMDKMEVAFEKRFQQMDKGNK